MLEKLHAKRANIVAQREQLIGEINARAGALALVDELIREEKAEQEQKAAEVAARRDREQTGLQKQEAPSLARPEKHPGVAADEQCENCPTPNNCDTYGCIACVPPSPHQ
jgi:hypothetical protein